MFTRNRWLRFVNLWSQGIILILVPIVTLNVLLGFSPNSEVDRGIEKHRRKSIVVGRVSPLRAAPATGLYKLSPVSLSQPVENNGISHIPSFLLRFSDLVGFGRIYLDSVGQASCLSPSLAAYSTRHTSLFWLDLLGFRLIWYDSQPARLGARPEGPPYLRPFVVKTRSGWPDPPRRWL